MKELIKKAGRLYEELDKLQRNLPLSIYDYETLIKIKCLLKVIIDRKENIVDLGEVWHWYKDEKPRNVDDLCVFVVDGIPIADVNNMISLERFVDSCFVNEIKAHSIRWAYLKDLLPKGGEK